MEKMVGLKKLENDAESEIWYKSPTIFFYNFKRYKNAHLKSMCSLKSEIIQDSQKYDNQSSCLTLSINLNLIFFDIVDINNFIF